MQRCIELCCVRKYGRIPGRLGRGGGFGLPGRIGPGGLRRADRARIFWCSLRNGKPSGTIMGGLRRADRARIFWCSLMNGKPFGTITGGLRRADRARIFWCSLMNGKTSGTVTVTQTTNFTPSSDWHNYFKRSYINIPCE